MASQSNVKATEHHSLLHIGKNYKEEAREVSQCSVNDGLHWWQRRRNHICILVFLGFLFNYCARANLSIAIVAMTSPIKDENGTILKEADFDWNQSLRGFILSSFFYGYLTTQIVGGWLAVHFGPYPMLAMAVGCPAIISLLIPLAAQLGVPGMIMIRILQGIFSGPLYPSNQAFWAQWAPPLERGLLLNFSSNGAYFGTVVIMFIGGIISENLGWPSLFYLTGCLGVVWMITWLIFTNKSPETDKYISSAELMFIKDKLQNVKLAGKDVKHPWKDIFTSLPVWSHMFILFSSFWNFNTLFSEIPTYFKDIWDFDLKHIGFMSGLPYLCLAIIMPINGLVADLFISRKILSVTMVRKVWVIFGFLGVAISILLLFVVSDHIGMIALLTVSMGFNSIVFGVVFVNPLDLARQHASIIFGFNNTFGCISGILSPIFAGYLTEDKTTFGWMIVFIVMSGLSILSAIFFAIFGSGLRQNWAIEST